MWMKDLKRQICIFFKLSSLFLISVGAGEVGGDGQGGGARKTWL